MCVSITLIVKFLGLINLLAAIVVILILPMPNYTGKQKIAILLGIDVDEFYPREIFNQRINRTTEDGSVTVGEVEYRIFEALCVLYSVLNLPASAMLICAAFEKSTGFVMAWFACKTVSIIIQMFGFIYYVTKASIMKNVMIKAFLNFAYTVGSVIIVYKAAISWPEGYLHVAVEVIRNWRPPGVRRLQEFLNRCSNQNGGENIADNVQLSTRSDDRPIGGAYAEVYASVNSQVNEAEELGEGVSTELDYAGPSTSWAVKETVGEEREMKSSVPEASHGVSARRSDQNGGENTDDCHADNAELITRSDNVGGGNAEVHVSVNSQVNEAEELGEGVSTEHDGAEASTSWAVKETVGEESEIKSSAPVAIHGMSASQRVNLEMKSADPIEVSASDKTEELKEDMQKPECRSYSLS